MPHPMWKCVCSISNCALPLCSVSKSACLSVPYQSIPCPSVPYQSIPCPSVPYQSIPCPSVPYQSIPCPSVPYQGIPCPLYFWRKLYAVLADGEGGNSGLFQVPVLLFEELFALWFMDISFQHLLPLLPYCVMLEPYFELFFSFSFFFFLLLVLTIFKISAWLCAVICHSPVCLLCASLIIQPFFCSARVILC